MTVATDQLVPGVEVRYVDSNTGHRGRGYRVAKIRKNCGLFVEVVHWSNKGPDGKPAPFRLPISKITEIHVPRVLNTKKRVMAREDVAPTVPVTADLNVDTTAEDYALPEEIAEEDEFEANIAAGLLPAYQAPSPA